MVRRINRDRLNAFIDSYRDRHDPDSDELYSFTAHMVVTNRHFARLYRIKLMRYERMTRHPKSCWTGSDAAWAHRAYARKVGHGWRASR